MTKIAVVGDVHISSGVSTRTDDYFSTCKNKLVQIFEKNDVVFFLGDIFDRPVIPTDKLYEICTLFMQYHNVRKYTILGNHDVFNMNEKTLFKTSLGLLNLLGLITVLKSNEVAELKDCNLRVGSMALNFSEVEPLDTDIVLGHHFYNLNCTDSFCKKDFDRLFPKAKYIFLGHDHEAYQPEDRVYRAGSLLRNAATEYNKKRKPVYYQLDSETGELLIQPIIAKEGKDIFVDNIQLKKREKYIEDLNTMIAKYSEKIETNEKYSMVEILKEIKTPEKAMKYISQTCKVLGVPLK